MRGFINGQILILALLFLVVISIISIALYSRVVFFVKFGSASILKEKATFLAEAGIDYAVFKLNSTSGYSGNPEISLGIGTFKIDVDPPGGSATTKKLISTGCIPNCDNAKAKRTIKVEVSSLSQLIYAVHSAESGKTFKMHSSSQVFGNVYSNGNICAEDDCSGNSDPATITGNAFAGGVISRDINVVSGTKTLNASFKPLPDLSAQINDWVTEADAGNTLGSTTLGHTTRTLGPTKINGNLTLKEDLTLTLNGPVHITGDLILDGNDAVKIYLNNNLGSQGTAIVVDGLMEKFRGGIIYPTNSSPKGFLFIISRKTGPETEMEVQGISGHAVFYSAGTAYIRTDGSTVLNGSLLAPRVSFSSSGTKITYDPDLQNWGNAGSGTWKIRRGSYKLL